MQNYAQNSNNYFENMLGETANIQSNGIPYFQILIIPDKIPYYNKNKSIAKWEQFSAHQVKKYIKLSEDNSDILFHSPTKTLFYLVKFTNADETIKNEKEYKTHYATLPFDVIPSDNVDGKLFKNSVIFNDYEEFMNKITHRILSL